MRQKVTDQEYLANPRLHDAFLEGFKTGIEQETGEEALRWKLWQWYSQPSYKAQAVCALYYSMSLSPMDFWTDSEESDNSEYLKVLFHADLDQLKRACRSFEVWQYGLAAHAIEARLPFALHNFWLDED